MIIFGGTTEGRLAAEVCDVAGTPFYYSTKGSQQDVEMHHGVRLCGAMTTAEVQAFCQEHGVRCIIDAAHPFAETLHQTIAAVGLPVIRLQRDFGSHVEGCVYCRDYNDATSRMEHDGVNRLLALSGANTISRLKPFWQNHTTLFRILQREESRGIAARNGLPKENIIYYDSSLTLPSTEQEQALMEPLHCDAIITKESGTSGGFMQKVQAALNLGMRVYVVEHPQLPTDWITVTGRHTLRRAIEHLVPEFFPLKTGLTTGACATAATKAALLSLLTNDCPDEVSFALPDGEVLTIAVECDTPGTATVIKDHSDDPDVLKGCRITSVVTLRDDTEIHFLQGTGVGKVTLPGLGIPVGGPAINPTPRRMMTEEIRQLTTQGVDICISVENGEQLAEKTFNHKVGVIGGISIIGTSGIVSPLSNDAFIRSIRRELEVAWAIGCRTIALVSGLKAERALQSTIPSSPLLGGRGRAIHYGNFIGDALSQAFDIGFRDVHLAIMIGKAVKLAEGNLDTHSHKVQMNKDFLKSIAPPSYHPAIDRITMARELWDIMPPEFFETIKQHCYNHCRTVFPEGEITIYISSPS